MRWRSASRATALLAVTAALIATAYAQADEELDEEEFEIDSLIEVAVEEELQSRRCSAATSDRFCRLPLACAESEGGGGGAWRSFATAYEHLGAAIRDETRRLPSASDMLPAAGKAAANPGVIGARGALRATWAIASSAVSLLDRTMRSLPLLWQETIFEVSSLPAGSAGALAISHDPYLSQQLACAALETLKLPPPGWLCGHLSSEVPGRVLERPCAPGGATGSAWWSWLVPKGTSGCECAQLDCRGGAIIRANPLRRPCLHFLRADGEEGGDFGAEGATAVARTSVATTSIYDYREAFPTWLRPWVPWSFPRAAANVAWGVLLLALAGPLSESAWVHISLAMAAGTTLAAVLVGYIMFSQGQMMMQRLPGGQFARQLAAVAVMLGVGPLVLQFDLAVVLLQWAIGGSLLFWSHGVAGYPWVGKAYFATSAFLGVLAAWRWQLFAEPAETASALQTWLNGRSAIRRMLTALGLWSLLHALSDPEAAAALALAACCCGSVGYWAWRLHMLRNSGPGPAFYRGAPLSADEYAAQGDENTARELEKLRRYVQMNPHAAHKGAPKNWGIIDLFVRGAPHVAQPDVEVESGRSWCVVQ